MVWIDPLEFIDIREDEFVLSCPNTFARKWVMSHYIDLIKAEIESVCEISCRVTLEVSDGGNGSGDGYLDREQLPLPNVSRRQHVRQVEAVPMGMPSFFCHRRVLARVIFPRP